MPNPTREPFNGPQHPSTILLSVHKAASTFLAHDLVPAMMRTFRGLRHIPFHLDLQQGSSVFEMALPPTGTVVTRLYPPHYDMILEHPAPADGRFADKKLIMLRRDPRDVAVSFYYSVAYSHPEPMSNQDRFRARRESLQAMGVAEGIHRDTARSAIRQFRATADFLERFPQTCLTTYEELIEDFPSWMRRVSAYLGWTAEETAAMSGGLRQKVAVPKEEDRYRHKRRVTPGNWREVFDDDLRKLFESRIGPEMAAAGYDW